MTKTTNPPFTFLVHDEKDSVGVAVADLKAGTDAHGRCIHGGKTYSVRSLADIPLGHKIALRDFAAGDTVVKYGADIGKVVAPIKTGEHVHVHNLKTKRW